MHARTNDHVHAVTYTGVHGMRPSIHVHTIDSACVRAWNWRPESDCKQAPMRRRFWCQDNYFRRFCLGPIHVAPPKFARPMSDLCCEVTHRAWGVAN